MERKRFFQSDELKNGDSIILCGFNKTRVKLNKNIRKTFGYKGLINDYERIICLKNARKANIPLYNGSIGTVKYVQRRFEKTFKAHIQMDGFDSFLRVTYTMMYLILTNQICIQKETLRLNALIMDIVYQFTNRKVVNGIEFVYLKNNVICSILAVGYIQQ